MDGVTENNNVPNNQEGLEVSPTEQRGSVKYAKADIVRTLIENRSRPPEDGQIVMAKMMVDLKNIDLKGDIDIDQLINVVRPAGYSLVFAEQIGSSISKFQDNLFNKGMVVLSEPVIYKEKMSYVAADRMGVFLIQEGNSRKGNSFQEFMRNRFDEIGDQEDKSWIFTDEGMANAKNWNSESVNYTYPNSEDVPALLKTASDESLKQPFISTKDMETRTKRFNPIDNTLSQKPSEKPISEIDF